MSPGLDANRTDISLIKVHWGTAAVYTQLTTCPNTDVVTCLIIEFDCFAIYRINQAGLSAFIHRSVHGRGRRPP